MMGNDDHNAVLQELLDIAKKLREAKTDKERSKYQKQFKTALSNLNKIPRQQLKDAQEQLESLKQEFRALEKRQKYGHRKRDIKESGA